MYSILTTKEAELNVIHVEEAAAEAVSFTTEED